MKFYFDNKNISVGLACKAWQGSDSEASDVAGGFGLELYFV